MQANHVQMDGFSESESYDHWEKMKDEVRGVECLFCNAICNNMKDALKHLEWTHCFNFAKFKNRHDLDAHSYIKLINFIRKKDVTPEQLSALIFKTWENDEYLAPVLQDDPWLMLDVDKLGDDVKNSEEYSFNAENECDALSGIYFAEF